MHVPFLMAVFVGLPIGNFREVALISPLALNIY